MPLSRYQIKNEYGLADPQLYKVAGKDDSEALLEGVAMAGLVGVLRQLGDLAQFAAEVFHDLHEEVMATSGRGHSLIIRVQQLEAEFPSIEMRLLTQTTHTSFLYNSGVDWHPNLRMDQNLVTRGDLPRFVMDSYEECRGPPRLFLLDKFDVAGAGACLKRYTDPSVFKIESISSYGRKSEGQREKKTRRVKKRVPCWRNGDSPESFRSSHAKLHQLFLEERLESGGDDPERRVKLKKRQFTGSFLDQGNKKSYMEKFVDTSLSEQKIVTTDGYELGLEIVEIGTVSPIKESMRTDASLCSSPDMRELEMRPSMDDFSESKLNEAIDGGAVEVPGLKHGSEACEILKFVKGEECTDTESISQVSVDDGFASEIDNYVDAQATIEFEVETVSECKNNSLFSNSKSDADDFYGSEEQREPQSLFSDSQSVGNSMTSEDGNNFFKERENSSCSTSVNSMAESTTDLEAHVVVAHVPASKSDPDNVPVDHNYLSKGIPGNETEEHAKASNGAVGADDIPKSTQDFGETCNIPCLAGSNSIVLPLDMEAGLVENSLPGPELDEEYSSFPNSGIVANQSAPKRTDYEHWSNGDYLLDYEASWNTGVHPETSHDFPNTPNDLVHVSHIASRKADSVTSSVEEHVNNLGMPNLDACSGIKQPVGDPPACDGKYPETINQIDVVPNVNFFVSSTGKNSEDQYCTPECAESFNIQEQFSETNNPAHALLVDSALEALPSTREDHSIKEVLADLEPEESTSSGSIVGVTEALPLISHAFQIHASEWSYSEIAEAAETADSGSLEADTVGTVSFGDEPNSKVAFASADETGEQCPGNNFNVDHDSVRAGDNEQNATLNAVVLERASVFQNIALIHQHQCEPAISSDSTAAEVNSTVNSNMLKVQHTEIAPNGCRQVHAENALHEDVMSLSPSEFLYAEKLRDQPVSLTEQFHRNEEELVPRHNADLAIQKDIDAEQDALVNSNSNLSSNGSSPMILVNSLLAEDVQNYSKSIDGVQVPLIPENNRQDTESTSSYLIQTQEYFDDSRCSSAVSLCSYAKLSVPNSPSKSAEYTLESSRKPLVNSSSVCPSSVLNGTSQAIQNVNPGQLDSPSFPVLDILSGEPPITVEPPPLPPLPPMQWRLGRFQNSSTATERQIVQRTPGSVQPVIPPTINVKTEIVVRSHKVQGQQGYSDCISPRQEVLALPVPVAFSDVASHNNIIGLGKEDSHSFAAAQISVSSLNGNQILEESCQPCLNPPELESIVEAHASGSQPAVVEQKLNTEIGYENGQPEHIPQATEEQETVKSLRELPQSPTEHHDWHPHPDFVALETGSLSSSTHEGISINAYGNASETLLNKPLRPRNPLIDEVVAIDKSKLRKVERVKPPVESKGDEGESLLEQLQLRKVGGRTKPQIEPKTEEIGPLLEQLQLRKVGERVKPEADLKPEETESPRVQLRKVVGRAHSMVGQKTEDRDSLLEQIRNKSFNLRPAVMARPNMQGPRTNLKVAAILQKASNIRQAIAGSDEEDDADSWSDC